MPAAFAFKARENEGSSKDPACSCPEAAPQVWAAFEYGRALLEGVSRARILWLALFELASIGAPELQRPIGNAKAAHALKIPIFLICHKTLHLCPWRAPQLKTL